MKEKIKKIFRWVGIISFSIIGAILLFCIKDFNFGGFISRFFKSYGEKKSSIFKNNKLSTAKNSDNFCKIIENNNPFRNKNEIKILGKDFTVEKIKLPDGIIDSDVSLMYKTTENKYRILVNQKKFTDLGA